MSDTINYYDAQKWLRETQPKRAKFPAVLVAIFVTHPDGSGAGAALSWLREGKSILDIDQIRLLQHRLPTLLCPMVVLALALLVVVGEYLVSQKGSYFGYQYGTVLITFCQCRIFGYKNGTFNVALLLWWLFSTQNRHQKCRNGLSQN